MINKKLITTLTICVGVLNPFAVFAETVASVQVDSERSEITDNSEKPTEESANDLNERTDNTESEQLYEIQNDGAEETEESKSVVSPQEEEAIVVHDMEKNSQQTMDIFEESQEKAAMLSELENERNIDLESGVWGTVPWTWNEETKTIELEAGNASTVATAPWKTYTSVSNIIVNDTVVLPEDCALLFSGITGLINVENSENFDTSNVTSMNRMFQGASNLTEIDVSRWDTSNVIDMSYMFDYASGLTKLDVSSWNTSNVIDMSYMFYATHSLTELNVSNWNTSSVTSMNRMFQGASSLIELDVSSWDTSSVTNMRGMFNSASGLTELDVSNWDTTNVTNMSYMFNSAVSLTKLNVSSWDTASVKDMNSMFYATNSLAELNVSSWNTSSVTSMNRMFEGASSLTELDVSSWDTSTVTNMRGMFHSASGLTELDVLNWNTASVTNMSYMFSSAKSLTKLDVSSWDTSRVTDMSYMFQSASSLTELDISNWDTTSVTNMGYMFEDAGSLTEIDVSNWNTTSVTDMSYMFHSASGLAAVDVSNWNTKNVTNMSYMFHSASGLTGVDVSNWDTSSATNVGYMFYYASSLTELDFSSWDTSSVTNMEHMFNGLYFLKKLVLGEKSIFSSAVGLREIPIDENYTGQWILNSTNTGNLPATPVIFSSSNEFMDEYDGSNPGTYIWEKRPDAGPIIVTYKDTEGNQLIEAITLNGKVGLPYVSEAKEISGWHLLETPSNASGVFTEESQEITYMYDRDPVEELLAAIDPVSDQSPSITGYVTESVDELTIAYQNIEGETITLGKNDSRIIWGDYQDSNQQIRYFRINLMENERLETETKVTIKVAKPSVETTGDRTEEQTVIKGIDCRANNVTLDRYKINELSTQEELETLILQESRAQATNVLTEADMTKDFRIVETDLTREVNEDGSYFAVLEVGNKAYQLTVGIDVTSKNEHLRVTIPTKMVFESLYNAAESHRNFESQTYEIRNQSPLAVDTYINQLAIDDPAGIVLLEAGEDPLDYAERKEEIPTLTYDDISTPLLRLNLKTAETQIQLYEAMEEQHLVRLEERSRVPISLTGDFYGDYPQWIVDTEANQGGYYEDLLVPNYRIVLRFVPRD